MGLLQATATNVISMVGRRAVPDHPVHGRGDGRAARDVRVDRRRDSGGGRRPGLRAARRRAAWQRRRLSVSARGVPAVRARPADGVPVHLPDGAGGAAVGGRRRGGLRRLPAVRVDRSAAAHPSPDRRGGVRRVDGAAVAQDRGHRPAERGDAGGGARHRRLGDRRRPVQLLAGAGVRLPGQGVRVRRRARLEPGRRVGAGDVQLRRLQPGLQHRRRDHRPGPHRAALDLPVDRDCRRALHADDHRHPRA